MGKLSRTMRGNNFEGFDRKIHEEVLHTHRECYKKAEPDDLPTER